jgi:hypothetical protein
MRRRAWRLGWALSGVLLFVAALGCDAASTPSGSASPSPTVAGATATPKPDLDAGVILEEFPAGGPRNEVHLENKENLRFKARASIKLHRIENGDVDPRNAAFALGSCTDCQTIAVAVQVVIYKRGAPTVAPQNVAAAVNVGCKNCRTVAVAIQYVIPVDDPKDVPRDVDSLVKDMDKELRFLASVKTWDQITSDEAIGRIDQVLAKYGQLQQYLSKLTKTETAENASPSPSATGSPTAVPQTSPAGSTLAPSGSPVPSPTATP